MEYKYSHIYDKNPMGKWHLRFGLTPNCNFSCTYCAPKGGYPKQDELKINQIEEILIAANKNGITRVHWTGGEPTLRKDFKDCLKIAKEIGYKKQIVTTNGYNLYKNLDECIDNGLSRVVVSLDTLKEERFKYLTKTNLFENVLKTIESSVEKLSSPTKISCCTMKSTLEEIAGFINYAENLNNKYNGSLILKFNQFFASNPAQIEINGRNYWKNEVVSREEIVDKLSEIGNLKFYSKKNIEGDNPSYKYFKVGKNEVIAGVLSMHTQNYACGGCHKLRITSMGKMSVCMDQNEYFNLVDLSLNKKIQVISEQINFRDNILDNLKPQSERKHFNSNLGSQRFGENFNKGKKLDLNNL